MEKRYLIYLALIIILGLLLVLQKPIFQTAEQKQKENVDDLKKQIKQDIDEAQKIIGELDIIVGT